MWNAAIGPFCSTRPLPASAVLTSRFWGKHVHHKLLERASLATKSGDGGCFTTYSLGPGAFLQANFNITCNSRMVVLRWDLTFSFWRPLVGKGTCGSPKNFRSPLDKLWASLGWPASPCQLSNGQAQQCSQPDPRPFAECPSMGQSLSLWQYAS